MTSTFTRSDIVKSFAIDFMEGGVIPSRQLQVFTRQYTFQPMLTKGTSTRERIIAAATQLFYSEGVRATSVDAVAGKAGITKKTLYYHFQTKDDLITAYLASRDQPELSLLQALVCREQWFDCGKGSWNLYIVREVGRGTKLARLWLPSYNSGARHLRRATPLSG